MSGEQLLIVSVMAATMALFVWDRWRYDLVALGSLLVCVALGLVEAETAFAGFGNPAVITVAAVLVISRALQRAGIIDVLASQATRHANSWFGQLVSLCLLAAFLSAFMNNVGALALTMPVALTIAKRHGYPPAALLMPLSFSTLLGGMVTLIGTPPNLLIADFRGTVSGARFTMFDFTPAGLTVAVAGIAFVVLIGWRLMPTHRKGQRPPEEAFEVSDYVTEVRVQAEAPAIGETVSAFERRLSSSATLVGLVRNERRLFGRLQFEAIREGDVLLLQTDSQTLSKLITDERLKIEEKVALEEAADPASLVIAEAVVSPRSRIQGQSPRALELRNRWGINLLAISRRGQPVAGRLRDARLRAGDVLLIEGDEKLLPDVIADLGCLPLVDRKLSLEPRRLVLPALLFATAIGLTAAELAPAVIAFTGTALILVVLQVLRPVEAYQSIDWPVIVLLGAMIPVGGALETTGTADLIAAGAADLAGDLGPHGILAIVLAATMVLTPLLNNAATVVIMAPIAISIARFVDSSADPFLMAVAIGASCDFLTPFGHQNNTIILGPGGYRFTDYWRMGLPLELIIVAASLAVLPVVWPFSP